MMSGRSNTVTCIRGYSRASSRASAPVQPVGKQMHALWLGRLWNSDDSPKLNRGRSNVQRHGIETMLEGKLVVGSSLVCQTRLYKQVSVGADLQGNPSSPGVEGCTLFFLPWGCRHNGRCYSSHSGPRVGGTDLQGNPFCPGVGAVFLPSPSCHGDADRMAGATAATLDHKEERHSEVGET